MKQLSLYTNARTLLAFFLVFKGSTLLAQQTLIPLVDGTVLGPGQASHIASIDPVPNGSINSKGGVSINIVMVLDDGLRRTHVNTNRTLEPAAAPPLFKIDLRNKSLVTKQAQLAPPGPVIRTSPWDLFGRRTYVIRSPKGTMPVVQGITEVSPNYVRVEGLDGEKGEFEWDMRLALSSLNSAQLRDILIQNANPNKPGDWLDIVSLFEISKRYVDARDMLVRAIHKFPELESSRSELNRLDQMLFDQLYEAAQIASSSGQHRFALKILESINIPGLSIETRLKVKARLETLNTEQKERNELIAWMKEDVNKLADGVPKTAMLSLIDEISTNLNADTALRFIDYRRRRSDTALKPDQLAALAISGWIFGPTIGEDNSSVVSSGIKARRMITDYLSLPTRNDQIPEDLSRLEAGTLKLVAKIIENMPPPVVTPASLAVVESMPSVDTAQQPSQVTIEGRYVIEVPMSGEMRDRTARYIVQLPPEYNPYRRYPCVFTLPSELSTMAGQLDWWVGPYDPESKRCYGEASRRGYIVISPDWAEPKQATYNYTENEQALMLAPLRDAKRRFSIDSDRVFVSGHFMGADAAWDLAWSHPDLWAGSVMIGGEARKYVIQYWNNARYVPSYFVTGENDGLLDANAQVLDNLLKVKQMDCLVTVYRGRKLDNFQEELPRIIDWMNNPARVRNPAPDKFEITTSRAGDRYFWWFETDQLFKDKLVHPLLYKAGEEYKIESSINREGNSVRLQTVPAKRYTVWLSPEIVDFNKEIIVFDNKSTKRTVQPKLDCRVILEDVHRRSDRQHPFWMRLDSK